MTNSVSLSSTLQVSYGSGPGPEPLSLSLPTDIQSIAKKVEETVSSRKFVSNTMQVALADEVRDTVVTRVATSLESNNPNACAAEAPLSLLCFATVASSTLGAIQNVQDYKAAEEIGWERGKAVYGLNATRSVSNASASASIIANRVVTTISQTFSYEDIKGPANLLSSGSKITSFMTCIFQGLSSILCFSSSLITLRSAHRMIKAIQLPTSIDNPQESRADCSLDDQSDRPSGISIESPSHQLKGSSAHQAMKYLLNERLDTSPLHVFEKLVKKTGSDPLFRKSLTTEAKRQALKDVNDTMRHMDRKLTKDEKKEVLEQVFSHLKSTEVKEALIRSICHDDAELKDKLSSLSGEQVYGFLISYQKQMIKQERQFSSITSSETLAYAKKLKEEKIFDRLIDTSETVRRVAEKDVEKFLTAVKQDLKDTCISSIFGVVLSIFGGIGCGLTMGFSAGVGAIAAASVVLFTNALTFISDWMDLSKGLSDKNKPAEKDVLFAKISVVLSAVALISAVAAVSFFSLGTAPLILAVLGGVMALVTSGYVYHKVEKQAQKSQQESPELSTIENNVKQYEGQACIDKKVKELINRLPKKTCLDLKNLLAKDFIEAEPKELSKEERIAEGRDIFLYEPSSASVLNALLELYHESLDMSFRRLHDEIILRKNTNQIFNPTYTGLEKDKEDALFQKIHLLSSKSEAENFFDENPISVVELKKAIDSLQKAG